MKKYIFTAIVFATAAFGCTKSNLVELPQSQETPITFEVYNGKTPISKATSIIGATGNPDNGESLAEAGGFHVTAFKHPDGTTIDHTDDYFDKDVTWSSSSSTWTTDYVVFWPGDTPLDFVAYGLNAKKTVNETRNEITNDYPTLVFDEGSFTDFTYTVPAAVADQEDLVVSGMKTTSLSATNGGTIQFQMEHVLSRIGFKVNVSGSAAVVINEITLYGAFSTSGTVDLTATTPAIAPLKNDQEEVVKTPTSYSLLPGDISFSPEAGQTQQIHSGTAENCYMMIIPGEVGNYDESTKPYIHIEYTLGGVEDEKDIPLTLDNTATGANMVFEAGKAYEYLFTISAAKIDFTGSVMDWDETGTDPGTPLN